MTQYEIEESQDYLQFKDLFTSSDLEFHLDKSGLQVEGGLGDLFVGALREKFWLERLLLIERVIIF